MGKKRNKKAIIITAVFMLVGILLLLAGFFGDWFAGLFIKDFDYKNIKPEDLGKTVKTDILVYYDDIDLPDKTMQFLGKLNSDTGDFAFIMLDLSGLSEKDKQIYYSNSLNHITIQGRLTAVSDAEFQEVTESLYELYDYIYYYRLETEGKEFSQESYDWFHQLLIEPYLPYCIKVESVSSFNWMPFIPAGAVILLVSLILEICFVFKLKKRIVLPVVFGIMILIPFALLFNQIRTILTVKKAGNGIYTMKNLECTDTRGMLESDSESIGELFRWIFDNHLYGMNFGLDENIFEFGCATFSAVTPEGDHLFARNFDYPETDALLVYSNPAGAYESIGVADLAILGVGQNQDISPDTPLGKAIMMITPYMVVDGMNEMGVGTGILQLDIDETHQDNGKPDLPIFCAVRGILDTCASVDEALALLESYDIHSGLGSDFHLFITDRSGRYVVVEWLDNEMVVTEHPYCTNSVIAPGDYYDMGNPDRRIEVIETCLGPELTAAEQEAMEVLSKVRGHGVFGTEWSCIYNLDNFTVNICFDAEYDTVYTFSADDFR